MPEITRTLASGSLSAIAGRALREVLESQITYASAYLGWLRQLAEAWAQAGRTPEQTAGALQALRAAGLLPKPYQVEYALELALSVTTTRDSETEASGALQLSFFSLGARRRDHRETSTTGSARLSLRLVPIDPPEELGALLQALVGAPPLPPLPAPGG
ncbi:MAG: hypothetical protein HY320_04165 [Armatimonadetes bacterium]|nr:hypothetical protein [Armatimonadota bacterium]